MNISNLTYKQKMILSYIFDTAYDCDFEGYRDDLIQLGLTIEHIKYVLYLMFNDTDLKPHANNSLKSLWGVVSDDLKRYFNDPDMTPHDERYLIDGYNILTGGDGYLTDLVMNKQFYDD